MSIPILTAVSALLLLVPAWLQFRSRPAQTRPSHWPPEVTTILKLCWWINRSYCCLVHRLVIVNKPDLPDTGPALLIANHTSGVDHFVLQAACKRVLGFMIAKEFYEVPVGNWFCRQLGCIPVNRNGKDMAATRTALRVLEGGRVLPIFPEGKILRTSGREIGPGKPGAAFLAWRSGAPIYPAYICGTPIVEGVWKAWFTPSRTRVIFGLPLDLSDLRVPEHPAHAEERAVLQTITERLMDAIRALQPLSLANEQS